MFQRVQFFAATDMHRSDKNLRHRHSSIGPLDHFVTALPIASDVDFAVAHALAREQGLGGIAKGAIAGRIDLDWRHDVSRSCERLLYGSASGRHNPRKDQHVDVRSARPQQGTGAGINGGAGREYIIDQYQAPTGYLGPVLAGHDKSALDIFGALRLRPPHSLRRRARTFESGVRNRHAAERGDRPGERCGLVEASRPAPTPMQGHWYERVDIDK